MFVHCPYCWQKYEVDEGFQGKVTICEKCQKKFKLVDSEMICMNARNAITITAWSSGLTTPLQEEN